VRNDRDFRWIDGERLIRYAAGAVADAPALVAQRGFENFALLTTERAAERAPALADAAARVLHVPSGAVPDAAAAVRASVARRPIVALGGGRVIDAAKAIAGADGLSCAAIPTTLSGAPMTSIHRMPAGVATWRLVRPSVVIADSDLMASQPEDARTASAMNALAHAAEAVYGPMANPMTRTAALRALGHLWRGLEHGPEETARHNLALGAIFAGYAVGSAGFALHHVVGQTLVRVTGAPHALAYAVLLPHTLRAMVPRAPEEMADIAGALHTHGGAEAAPERVAELAARSGATRLSELGVRPDQVEAVVEEILARPDLANTPDPPEAGELRRLIEGAL
jgi:alcohol dehydrogenase class IV